MPRRVTIKPHLSIEELETCYRQTSDPIERSRYQIIWLLAKGKLTSEVAEVTGYCEDKRFAKSSAATTLDGPCGLVDLERILEKRGEGLFGLSLG